MLESIYIFISAIAIFFVALTFTKKNEPAYAIFAVLFCILAMAGSITVEVPYAVENTSENASGPITGTMHVYSQAPLAMVYFGITLVLILQLMGIMSRGK